jgi:molybdenum cofactor biosynthesis enzyme MoaA
MLTFIKKRQLVQNKLVSPSPNLSLMLPGWCNAKCDFCFWEREQEANKFPQKEYANKVAEYLDSLPNSFHQISVTGGEPTISPVFDDVLKVISERKNKFNKIVLTTNGINLAGKADIISGVIDHINISRHHYDDNENAKIFKTDSCPNTEKLRNLVNYKYGNADMCFNCVIPPTVEFDFCEKMIDYAISFKKIAALNFRIFHNAMDECNAQEIFVNKYGAAYETRCPVCRVAIQRVRGQQINWKYSILEPTQNWNGIYELVMQPTGQLTADWNGVHEVKPNFIEPYEKSIEEELLELEEVLNEQ